MDSWPQIEMGALAFPPLPFPVAWARMNSRGLHEHPGGAAAGVVDAPLVRFEHLDQQPHHAARRVELAASFALGLREAGEEVLVDAPQHVPRSGVLVAHDDVADLVDQPAQALLVECGSGVVLRQDVAQRRVRFLDSGHGCVGRLPDGGLAGLRLQHRPARRRGHPEDVASEVLVGVVGVGALVALGLELRAGLLEGIGDVLEEDEPEHDVLVLAGVHAAAQCVGHLPELGLVAGGDAVLGGHGLSASGQKMQLDGRNPS